MHAMLGGSEHCIATYPGDLAVALVALDAEVEIAGPDGERRVPIERFHRLPGDTPHIETVLRPARSSPPCCCRAARSGSASHYFKVRDRASYEFALASAAVALEMDGGARAAGARRRRRRRDQAVAAAPGGAGARRADS